MMRRAGWLLLVVVLVVVAVWLPREDEVAADLDLAVGEPVAVELRASRKAAVAPSAERWELGYPESGPTTQTLILEIAPLGTPANPSAANRSAQSPSGPAGPSVTAMPASGAATRTGRLTAVGSGDPTPLLDRLLLVFGAEPRTTLAPDPGASAVRLDLLGERLSYGPGEVGARVVAGAFTSVPSGDWRVYRITHGTVPAPQYFLGVSERAGAARILPRALEDAPAIVAAFRALLLPAPPGES